MRHLEKLGYLSAPYSGVFGVFGVACTYRMELPAGLRCRFLPSPSGGRWVLDEFPRALFPVNSFERHDAEHSGFDIPESFITLTKQGDN